MLKKSDAVEIIAAGGFLYMEDGQRAAKVYTVSDCLMGSVRFDTARRIAASGLYDVVPDIGYSRWYRVCDPGAIHTAKAEAAGELAAIRAPGYIRIRAKNDCRIGCNYVSGGRSYLIRVYGDGTHDTPSNAWGKLYDFRAADHAVYFDIVERPTADGVEV